MMIMNRTAPFVTIRPVLAQLSQALVALSITADWCASSCWLPAQFVIYSGSGRPTSSLDKWCGPLGFREAPATYLL